ncbi:MAG: diaminopimelate decarboxylase, partial [Abditibacteriota bacterium]|nr:diaminopimelate decarboxylase [Abditibacteriota bacterium]
MLLENQTINKKGHLEINGCDTVSLAEEYGTPLYVMDEDVIRDRCRRYLSSFRADYPMADVAYASKAFTVVAMCALIKEEGLWLDAASRGELYTALLAGFDPSRIVLHGNFKTGEELRYGVSKGVAIVCDSFREIEQLGAIALEYGVKARVMVRCNPGIDPHTHTMISTGQEDSK